MVDTPATPAADPAPAPEPEDNFAAAFEQLAALGPEATAAQSGAALAGETPPADPAPADPAPADPAPADPAPADPAPADPAPADPAPADPAPAPADPAPAATDDLLNRLADLVAKKPEAPAPAAPAAPAAEVPPVYTADEQSFLDSYEKDWPDVARAEALKRRAEYRELVGFVFQEIAKEFGPVLGTVSTLAERTHLNDLTSQVEDYDAIRDKVVAWVDTQPGYLKAAYTQVVTQGSVDEVVDLIQRYRAATGDVSAPAPATPATPATPAAPAPGVKEAAAALKPVPSKRTTVAVPADPADFDGAFAEFAKAVK